MDDATFWQIVGSAPLDANGDCTALAEVAFRHLCRLPPTEIVAFDSLLGAKLQASYSYPLWGAAYLILRGCSDDSFDYFRGWLITQGEKVFLAALAQPDSLADVIGNGRGYYQCEDLLGAAQKAHEKITGKPIRRNPTPFRQKPVGTNWDFNDKIATAAHLPRLSQLLLR